MHIACKKSVPSNNLPPITQTGANTFGCKINGQVWVPYWRCIDLSMGAVELEYNIYSVYSTGVFPFRFNLGAGKSGDPFQGIFHISPAFLRGFTTSDGSYIYGTGNVADSMEIHFFNNSGDWTPKHFDSNNIFQITKLDTVNKIVSGIFSFSLYNSPTDSIAITDGRFDLQIRQYSHCTN